MKCRYFCRLPLDLSLIHISYARTGILDKNPIHEDMVAAAEMAHLAFICNVVIDEDKKTVAAFAGHFNSAHRKGVDFLSNYCVVKPAPADIVITKMCIRDRHMTQDIYHTDL